MRSVRFGRMFVALAVFGWMWASVANAEAVSLGSELRALVRMPAGPPGAITIVQRRGHVSAYRAGVGDARSRSPMESTDHMRMASVSKAFSGAVSLALVDRGVLSLHGRVSKLLPGLPPAWGSVTLE